MRVTCPSYIFEYRLYIVTFPVSVRISPVCTVQYYNMSFLNIEKEENDQNMQYLQRQLPFACQWWIEIESKRGKHKLQEGRETSS